MTNWLNETLYPDWGQRFQVMSVLADEHSDFQHIVVFQSASHGRVLVLDGCIQVTEADEFFYQEMIAHVPLIAHGAPRRVLIIGAGDGGVLRRVLQHSTIEHATMVEIDGAVIRLSREFLPGIAGDAWDDSRAEIIIGDGIAYVASARPASVDVIIVDSTDPAGVGETLFTEQFYADCARILAPGGIIVNQAGVPFAQPRELRDTSLRRARSFRHVTAFTVAVPTYVGGLMALGFASNRPGRQIIGPGEASRRAEAAGIAGLTRFWTPTIQSACFELPPYIRDLLPTP